MITTEDEMTLDDLAAITAYNIYVVAVNAHGSSLPSYTIQATTLGCTQRLFTLTITLHKYLLLEINLNMESIFSFSSHVKKLRLEKSCFVKLKIFLINIVIRVIFLKKTELMVVICSESLVRAIG